MSFHTDAVDAVNAFVAVHNSMKRSSQDEYYDWLLKNDPAYKKAQIEKEAKKRQAEKDALAAKQAAAAGTTASPAPVTTAGINMPPLPPTQNIGVAPGMGGAIATAPPDFTQGQIQGQDAQRLRRGGIAHYEGAGPVVDERADPETGGLSVDQLWQIRQMSARAEAEREARNAAPALAAPKAIDVGNPNTLNRSARAGGYDPRVPADPTEGTEFAGQGTMPPETTSSGIGRWVRGLTQQSPEASAINEVNGQINRLMTERQSLAGPLTQQTGPQRIATEARAKELDAQIAGLVSQRSQIGSRGPAAASAQPAAMPSTPTMPTAPTQTTPVTPQPPPTSAGGAPSQPPPAAINPDIGPYGNAGETALYRAQGTRTAPGVGAPPGTATEPPPGSLPVPATPGGGGGGPGGGVGRRSARPAIRDQSRVEQYDPTLDAADTGNVKPVFSGGAVNPIQYAKIQDAAASYDKALAGGVNFAEFLTHRGENHPHSEPGRLALQAHVGMMPVPVAQATAAAWSMGGKLAPPDALTRYMMTQYEIMLERGETAMANQMAFEVMQRLNYEAAVHGQKALDALRQNNIPLATKLVQAGHRWSTDGKIMQVTADGKYMGMYDQFTGKPTSPPVLVTPQGLLAGALGLSDGTGVWNHLAQRAEMFKQSLKATDKDAEGRALRNINTRYRGELLRRKLDAPPKAAAGATGAPPVMDQFRQTAHGTQPKVGSKQVVVLGGGDTDEADLMREETGTPEEK